MLRQFPDDSTTGIAGNQATGQGTTGPANDGTTGKWVIIAVCASTERECKHAENDVFFHNYFSFHGRSDPLWIAFIGSPST